jgi:hypothetical protein
MTASIITAIGSKELNLPLPVLKLYHDHAMRWIPGIDTHAH